MKRAAEIHELRDAEEREPKIKKHRQDGLLVPSPPCPFDHDDALDLTALWLLRASPDADVFAIFVAEKGRGALVAARLMKQHRLTPQLPSLLSNSLACASWLAALKSFSLLVDIPSSFVYRDAWFDWSPATHLFFSLSHRRRVMAALSVLSRLPPEVRLMVLRHAFCSNSNFAETDTFGSSLTEARKLEILEALRVRVSVRLLEMFLSAVGMRGTVVVAEVKSYCALMKVVFTEREAATRFDAVCASVMTVLEHITQGLFVPEVVTDHLHLVLHFFVDSCPLQRIVCALNAYAHDVQQLRAADVNAVPIQMRFGPFQVRDRMVVPVVAGADGEEDDEDSDSDDLNVD